MKKCQVRANGGFAMQTYPGASAAGISAQEIEQRLVRATDENGWKPATVNRYRATLSLIFRLAIRNGKLVENQVRQVTRFKENNARVRFLTAEEEKQLRTAIREKCPDHESELDLALHTGLRMGEQFGLCWENINTDLRVLIVPRSKHGEARHVPLNSAALGALDSLRRLRLDSLFVCGGKKGPRHWFKRVVREASVRNFHWHDLRNTFASRLVMAGVDIRTVQELLGHKTLTVTLRYAHLAPEHELEAVERLVCLDRTDTQTSTHTSETSTPEAATLHQRDEHVRLNSTAGRSFNR